MPDTLTTRLASACELAQSRTDAAGDKRALEALAQAAHLAVAANVISPNDTLREVSTRSLRVLFIPSMQAEVEGSARIDGDLASRKVHVQNAIGAAYIFLRTTTQIGALAPELSAILKRRAEAPATLVGAAEAREQKIMLFKLERTLRAHLDAFRVDFRVKKKVAGDVPGDAFYDLLFLPPGAGSAAAAADEEDDDDDDEAEAPTINPAPPRTLREYLLQLVELHAVHTAGVLDSANQEYELLRAAPREPRAAPPIVGAGAGAGAGDAQWRLDPPARGPDAPLLSEAGRPLRPFTIMPSQSRTQVHNYIFKPGHRLPTMTIDEYLAEERRRGNIISGGGPAQAAEPTPREARAARAEDDGTAAGDTAADEARAEAINWDEFAEAHPRGAGNTMNRG